MRPTAPAPGAGARPSSAAPPDTAGVFAPFKHRLFLAFWTAGLVSNFGVLIQGVGASWLVTSLSRSALTVTLVTVATVLPMVLFSLAAGALADVWNRRRVMLAAQTLMLLVSGALAALTYADRVTPTLLLALTFLLGCGTALYAPASQSGIGDLVPRGDLAGAVSLNSLGFNLARAVGPAAGGVIVAAAGPEAAFALNACTYVPLVVVLARWRYRPAARDLPPETIPSAMVDGLRYALLSTDVRTVLVRALFFGLFASALTALMPLIARDRLDGTSLTYGLLLGAFGAGSVAGALLSGRLRARFSNEAMLRVISLAYGLAAAAVGYSTALPLTLGALVLAGASWVVALAMFNVVVQLASPRWVVGRLVAVTQTVLFGGFAAGSLGWGVLTEARGLTLTLTVTGLGVAASALLGLRFPIATPGAADATAADPQHHEAVAIDVRSGPVVTTVQYRVAEADAEAFVRQVWDLRGVRRRGGSRRWAILRDLADPELWIERFENRTWLDHLRQAERFTAADADVRRRVTAFHRGADTPRVEHALERSPGSFTADGRDRTAIDSTAFAIEPHLAITAAPAGARGPAS